jgi:transcriptional regulator with XRE-family HTH domain
MSNRDGLLDADVDLVRLGTLIAQARREARMTQPFLANKVGTSDRTLSRWESGAQPPSREQLKRLIAVLVKANSSTLDELRHAGHLQPKLTPVPTPTPTMASVPPALLSDPQSALDEVVRAYAEDLDISARRLRSVLGLVLGEIERLGVPLSTARDLVTHSPKRRV